MKKYNNYDLFASLLVIVMFAIVTVLSISHQKTRLENKTLRSKVDSLTTEVLNLNVSLDESTNIAMSLSDRLNKLYEIDKDTHRKLFIEAD